MAHYAFVFGDLRTGQQLAEIPLQGVTVNSLLNGVGELRGAFGLDLTGYRNADLVDSSIPGLRTVTLEREGYPIWDGYITSRWYQSQAKIMQFSARHIAGYPYENIIDFDYVRTATEQTSMFIELWQLMQAGVNRNARVDLPSAVATGITKNIEVYSYDFKTFGAIMDELANGINGFDWTVDIGKSGGVYVRTLRYGYPNLGQTVGVGTFVLDYPGPILNYFETENQIATRVHGLGSGSGANMIRYTHPFTDIEAIGLRFDTTVSFDSEDLAILTSLTKQDAETRRPPGSIFKVDLKADEEPVFGSYALGDIATLAIMDPKHPDGLQVDVRLARWDLKVPSSEATEEVSLTFAGDANV